MKVQVWQDQDAENPIDGCGIWVLAAFDRRSIQYRHPEEVGYVLREVYEGRVYKGPKLTADSGLKCRIRAATAFPVHETGDRETCWCVDWNPNVPPYDWEDTRGAGLLYWIGPARTFKPPAAYLRSLTDQVLRDGAIIPKGYTAEREALRRWRYEMAQGILETYNHWANGECYGFSILDDEGEVMDSCGGYYGEEDVADGVRDSLREIMPRLFEIPWANAVDELEFQSEVVSVDVLYDVFRPKKGGVS